VEKSSIPKIFIRKKAILQTYSKGLTSALVFESGALTTSLVAVEDGYVHQETYNAVPFGGDTITDMIGGILIPEVCVPGSIELDANETYSESFYEYFRFLMAEDIKHKLLNLNPKKHNGGGMDEEYLLPDGIIITMNEED
jgi:hypothetical protein